eukprot:g247.t1
MVSFSVHRCFRALADVAEICIRTRGNGWVVGRRANQSHREYFVLIDDRVTELPQIQDQIYRLERLYFNNIFVH